LDFHRYESCATPESLLVKDLDKLEAEATRKLRQEDPLPLAVNLTDAQDNVQEARINLSMLK
jgi:hypothetical protein